MFVEGKVLAINAKPPEMPGLVETKFKELGVILPVPKRWKAMPSDSFDLLLVAPVESSFQPSLGISRQPTKNGDVATLDALVSQLRQEQSESYRFEQNKLEGMEIEGRPARLRYYDWTAEMTGVRYSQIQTVILADPATIYVITGTTLKRLENRFMPLLDTMTRSIKFIS